LKLLKMNNFWDEILAITEAASGRVGQKLLTNFGQGQATEKADGSLVTQSDQWADRELRRAIANAFPDHGILSEEGDHCFPNRDWCWIIDPLDGTTNFARGIPIWGISLGLLYRGIPVFGYVAMPPLQQSFHGYWQSSDLPLWIANDPLPQGAFLNGQPIHTRSDSPGSNQFFSLCARSTAVLKHPFPCKIRMLGSASYNFLTVAAGATLGGMEATPKIWDIAAAWVIVQAAGGHWLSLDSDPPFPLEVGMDYGDRSYPTLVASQPELIDFFYPYIQGLMPAQT
jgi:myo-inositol-1(or 4)-monophosphatase